MHWFVAQGDTVASPLSSRFELVSHIILDEIVLFKGGFSGGHEGMVSLLNLTGQRSEYKTVSTVISVSHQIQTHDLVSTLQRLTWSRDSSSLTAFSLLLSRFVLPRLW